MEKKFNGFTAATKKSIQSKFGKRVRCKRIQMKLTQGELSDRCGLHWTYISSMERGERNVSIINLFKLAKALDCLPTIFLSDD